MKKVFLLFALSLLFVYTAQSQDLIVKHEPLPTIVSSSMNSNKAVYDYSGVEEIRAHILSDKELSHNMDLYGPVPQMKLEVKLNAKGYLTDVKVIEGGNGEHAFYLKKSIKQLKMVTPIKIEGINVSQKVHIPITFK